MSVFSIVKASVTALQVAQRYGLRVNSRGMACCPFHSDKSPSMKVNRRYYCFGCGVTGDAVDLASQLLGLSPREAALTVANDFGLHMPDKAISNRSKPKVPAKPKVNPREEVSEWIRKALRILLNYGDQLLDWKQKYVPASMDEEWHPLFCEALQKKSFIDYLLDELLDCSKAEFVDERRR